MAKQTTSIKFNNAYVDRDTDTITEVTKDGNIEHSLSETLELLEGKEVNISFTSKNDFFTIGEE